MNDFIFRKNLKRFTTNSFWYLYPAWSPDDTQIAFLSKREKDLEIYVMNIDGNSQHKLYDSGSNDADIDWVGDTLVFTSMFSIWRIEDDGTSPALITNLSNAGQWGIANLPVGDYDPRLRSDGAKIVFERLEDPNSQHGNYNIFVINVDGTGETRLTNTGYSQGLANWSHSGDRIVYVVAAINNGGKYDIYVMNADGTNNHNATPSYFPTTFLCHSPVFSKDDSKIYFIGQWS
jgi:Tol biopolymer transport system component